MFFNGPRKSLKNCLLTFTCGVLSVSFPQKVGSGMIWENVPEKLFRKKVSRAKIPFQYQQSYEIVFHAILNEFFVDFKKLLCI